MQIFEEWNVWTLSCTYWISNLPTRIERLGSLKWVGVVCIKDPVGVRWLQTNSVTVADISYGDNSIPKRLSESASECLRSQLHSIGQPLWWSVKCGLHKTKAVASALADLDKLCHCGDTFFPEHYSQMPSGTMHCFRMYFEPLFVNLCSENISQWQY